MANYFDKVLTLGGGINTGAPPLHIKDEEAVYLRNMDSWKYPSAAVRPGRTTYPTILSTNAHTIGQRDNCYVHAVEGNTWKYWNGANWVNVTTALTSTEGEFGEFATGTAKYTLYMNSTNLIQVWDGTTTVPATVSDTNAPQTRKFTVNKGRIYALTDRHVKYCALNKTTDWTTANDAGSITVTKAKGPLNAVAEYNDHIIIFTECSMHELYGTGPAYYELIDIEGDVGCVSQRSLVKVERMLYWLWYDGIYEYSGGSPRNISKAVEHYIRNINWAYRDKVAGGAIDHYLYMAIPYGASATANNLILKFDTHQRIWFVETGEFKDFMTIYCSCLKQNVLYGLDSTGQIWHMRDLTGTADSATPIAWEFITKPFMHGNPSESNTLNELWLVADISTGSTAFTVGYSTKIKNNDSTTFTTIKTLSGSSETQNQRVILKPAGVQKQDWYRLRFAGTGQAEIHYLEQKGGITK